jgi:hypothetical protein
VLVHAPPTAPRFSEAAGGGYSQIIWVYGAPMFGGLEEAVGGVHRSCGGGQDKLTLHGSITHRSSFLRHLTPLAKRWRASVNVILDSTAFCCCADCALGHFFRGVFEDNVDCDLVRLDLAMQSGADGTADCRGRGFRVLASQKRSDNSPAHPGDLTPIH